MIQSVRKKQKPGKSFPAKGIGILGLGLLLIVVVLMTPSHWWRKLKIISATLDGKPTTIELWKSLDGVLLLESWEQYGDDIIAFTDYVILPDEGKIGVPNGGQLKRLWHFGFTIHGTPLAVMMPSGDKIPVEPHLKITARHISFMGMSQKEYIIQY
jgi:hypothetical protein